MRGAPGTGYRYRDCKYYNKWGGVCHASLVLTVSWSCQSKHADSDHVKTKRKPREEILVFAGRDESLQK